MAIKQTQVKEASSELLDPKDKFTQVNIVSVTISVCMAEIISNHSDEIKQNHWLLVCANKKDWYSHLHRE